MWTVLVPPALLRPEEDHPYDYEHVQSPCRWVIWNPDAARDADNLFAGNWSEMRPACYYTGDPAGVT